MAYLASHRPCENSSPLHHRFLFTAVLRLRPALIRASRVLPSTPPLFHSFEQHFFEGQFGGFPVSD